MRIHRCFWKPLLVLAVVGTLAFADQLAKRAVTVNDAIEMTDLSYGYVHGNGSSYSLAEFSPDGTKFVVVLRKGNVNTNRNDFELWLFYASGTSPQPKPVVTMSSSSSRVAIQNVSWCQDNQKILFQGEKPGQSQQVYMFNIRTRALRQITHHPSNIVSFSTTPDCHEIAYTAELPPSDVLFDEDAQRNGLLVTDQLLWDLVARRKSVHYLNTENRVFIQEVKGGAPRIEEVSRIPVWRETPFISPDGKDVVIASQILRVPASWTEYSPPVLHSFITEALDPGQYSRLVRYVLIDLYNHQERILLNAPVYTEHGAVNEVAWSPNSKLVAIGNVYLPLEDARGEDRELRRSTPFTVEIKVPEGAFSPVTHENLHLRRWGTDENTLIFDGENILQSGAKVEGTDPGREVGFHKNAGKWTRLAELQKPDYRPTIDEEDDVDTPPRLTEQTTGSQPVTILDLNPQFANLKFGKVEQIAWTASDGRKREGLLYYPIDYQPSMRYPLVIQTHGFIHGRFQINGAWAPFAAQELAGHNIMVLQADTQPDYPKNMGTIREAPEEMAAFEGAIDYLDQKGQIDRERVGIIGFSRTCLHVKYTLTHSKYHFAAASVVEGVDNGYYQYMTTRASGADGSTDWLNGGPPFGKNLQEWLQRSTSFNIDKVTAPVLIDVPATHSVISEWEWLSALRALNKPVEMVVLEDGEHPVERPWEKRVLQEYGTVDWFCFWLKGDEDPDPAKKAKYERWRELRKLQNSAAAASYPQEH